MILSFIPNNWLHNLILVELFTLVELENTLGMAREVLATLAKAGNAAQEYLAKKW